MANEFKNDVHSAIGTTPTTVYTCPASTQAVIIGMTLANILGSSTSVELELYSEGVWTHIVAPNTPLSVGSSLIAAGGEQKIVVAAGNSLRVTAEHASAVDCVISILEIS